MKPKKPSTREGIVDFAQYRKNKTEQRFREYERVLFNRVLGVYSYAERNSLDQVEVVDISFKGIRYRERGERPSHEKGEEVALRFYFTPSSYMKIIVEIKRIHLFEEAGIKWVEYGGNFNTQTKSYAAMKQLVSFLQVYSEVACQDHSPPQNWF